MHDRISEAVYNNEYSAGIILSLAKAVVTLDPKIILYDLEYYVICSIQVNWFKTYLNNHAQRELRSLLHDLSSSFYKLLKTLLFGRAWAGSASE